MTDAPLGSGSDGFGREGPQLADPVRGERENRSAVEPRRLFAREPLAVAALAATGAICGAAAKMADGTVADLGTDPGAWVLALAVIGSLAPTAVRAAVRSGAFLAAMTLAYYMWSSLVLSYPAGRYPYFWLALAVTAAPGAAAAVWWATRRRGVLAGAVMAATAASVFVDGTVQQLWMYAAGRLPQGFPLRPAQAALNIVAVLVIVIVLPRNVATRAWAAAMVIPMSWILRPLIEMTYGAVS